jgi:hypothetical protein
MKLSKLSVFAASMVLLTACATQPAPMTHDAPGLLLGFFHGFTAIFSLVGSIFLQVRVYAFPNSGFWYDFGFVTGVFSSLLAIFLASMARIGGMLT